MKPIVIYHANCADGFAAMWCFRKVFGDIAEYYPGVYNKAPPNVLKRNVYLVDFSYKRDVIIQMLDQVNNLTLIDHHDTALRDLADVRHPKFEKFCALNKSGAMLAWEYLSSYKMFLKKVPPLILHIQDRDLWQFKLPFTRDILACLFSYDYDYDVWDSFMTRSYFPDALSDMAKEGSVINRKYWKDLKEVLRVTKRKMKIGDNIVNVANTPMLMASDAATELAKGELYAAVYQDTSKNRQFSLRSVEGEPQALHVGDIAFNHYNGGGHKHAAGFVVDREHELART